MKHLPKRIYRMILLSLLVLIIAPMEDGCKYEKASAGVVAVPKVAVLTSDAVIRAKGKSR